MFGERITERYECRFKKESSNGEDLCFREREREKCVCSFEDSRERELEYSIN